MKINLWCLRFFHINTFSFMKLFYMNYMPLLWVSLNENKNLYKSDIKFDFSFSFGHCFSSLVW